MNEQAELFDFDGTSYVPKYDQKRLTGQTKRVWKFMKDQKWHTLAEIEIATGAPQASASAHLRDFRKKRFGFNQVEKRRKGNPYKGCFEYRLIINFSN